jgi:hypothetical protein
VLSLLVSIAVIVDWVVLFSNPDTRGMHYFGGFLALLVLAVPTWYIGVPLLATGRSQQRGPVRRSVLVHVSAGIRPVGGRGRMAGVGQARGLATDPHGDEVQLPQGPERVDGCGL